LKPWKKCTQELIETLEELHQELIETLEEMDTRTDGNPGRTAHRN
jgi:hypothetical protein